VIAQANEKAKIGRLEALIKILTFCQGNRFVPSSLVFMMLDIEKGPVN
jgi:hypothetical protein